MIMDISDTVYVRGTDQTVIYDEGEKWVAATVINGGDLRLNHI
jgi:hypothetical protein